MGKTLNISDEDRALLTDEEIAGMEEGEEFDEGEEEGEGEGDPAAAGATTDTPAADAAPADDAASQAAAQAEPDAAAEAAVAQQQGNDDGAAQGRDDGAPVVAPVMSLPDDYDDQVAKIAEDKKVLFEQFGEGDIDGTEYAQKLDEIGKRERQLERLKDRVEDATRTRYETWVNVHVGGFLAQHPEYQANPMLMGVLDTEVKKLQNSAEIDTDPQILVDAHAAISKAFPGVFGDAKPAPAAQQEKKPTPPAAKPTAPTLAKVPAADIDQPGEGKFSFLDRLSETDPLRYEAELAKLSPADLSEYLAS